MRLLDILLNREDLGFVIRETWVCFVHGERTAFLMPHLNVCSREHRTYDAPQNRKKCSTTVVFLLLSINRLYTEPIWYTFTSAVFLCFFIWRRASCTKCKGGDTYDWEKLPSTRYEALWLDSSGIIKLLPSWLWSVREIASEISSCALMQDGLEKGRA